MGISKGDQFDRFHQIEEDLRSIITLVGTSTEPIEPQTIATILDMLLENQVAFNKKLKR